MAIKGNVVPYRKKKGGTSKRIKTSGSKIDMNTPRDRAGSFEPQFVKKHQTSVCGEIESKILSMYGQDLSCSDIREFPQHTEGHDT